jgi:CHAD domain-containing protein
LATQQPAVAFVLADGVEPQGLLETLAARLPARVRPPTVHRVLALDTFDGRLLRDGASLRFEPGASGGRLLVRLPGWQAERALPAAGPPAFATDLPERLRARLTDLIEMRRLLPLLDAELHEQELPVLDEQRRTVARLRLTRGSVRRLALDPAAGAHDSQPLAATLVARPVRGHADALAAVLPMLRSLPGLHEAAPRTDDALHGPLLAALPPRPPSPGAGLRPDQPAADAMRAIHRALLATLLLNEEGVRLDLDSEFLHDYRVAVRRARCLLGQVRRVFPAADVERWRTELSWLGRLTGPQRDLDVLLLRVAELGAGETGKSEPGARELEPLVAHVRALQRHEHARLVAQLADPRYAALLSGWSAYLDRPAPAAPGADHAAEPIGRLAGRRVHELYRRLRRRGRALGPDSPPEELHALRIAAKKLRYVLDGTRSALDGAAAAPLLAGLKRLQSALGDVQDSHVHDGLLEQVARHMAAAGNAPPATLRAVEALRERVRTAGEEARAKVGEQLQQFAAPPMRALSKRLRGPA